MIFQKSSGVFVWGAVWLSLTAFLTAAPVTAQQTTAQPVTEKPPLIVATKDAPPFAMQGKDGKWTGLAVELMEEIARDLDRKVTWTGVETTKDLIDTVAAGSADAGMAAVTITSEREKFVDFSHSYYDSGLTIAVPRNQGVRVLDIFKALSSPAFLATVGTLGLLLLAIGALIWFVERRQNSDQFDDDPISGIGDGFWWSAVTMTTVGYGDKAPVTPLGRAIAVVWMFAALILTAVFTAQLATSLTVGSISGPVKGLDDLASARVGVVDGSASTAYFENRFIRVRGFSSLEAGLDALANNSIDAFVHDEPILRFTVLRDYTARFNILSQLFEPQDYGIVLPPGSELREPLNQALLDVKSSPRWQTIRSHYFGRQE
ncbi:MAG: transporter substrate-binding domain-containing protein [Alphaproteobacteria bacterium]|nr:transporter substrate-binding domain-containing protein [Alphaproteobacteria bacterium]